MASTTTPVGAFRRSVKSLLAGLAEKDPCSEGHPERVARTCVAIAAEFRLEPSKITALVLAAHVHDVGKISVPDPILLKPGALTAREYELVKGHSTSGARLIEAAGLHPIAAWIRSHHERWDGTGYPARLKGTEIPVEARILCVADALDAMTSNRIYRGPVTPAAAADELERCAGTQFDPQIARWTAGALRSGDLVVDPPTPSPRPAVPIAKTGPVLTPN